ncbi:MAG: transcriptional regulator Spx [Erysipelotrichales bacterium]|nr:transcriptional regulator Spx [Erysipelotrichales bacterium]
MILLYTSHGCASCRKAKEWLKERKIPFIEKNIFTSILQDDELRMILRRTENGTEDIIAKRAKVLTDQNINLEDMSVKELMAFIRENPSVMKRPIILDENHFMVGYDAEDMEMFIPRELRKVSYAACNEKCPNYAVCGEIRDTEQAEANA